MAEQDIIPAGSTARLQMGGPMGGVRSFMAQPAVARSLPIIGLLAALAITAAAWLTFNVPPQRPLFEGLQETDKAAVASSLQSAGINYTLDSASGAISVADQDFHKARMLLAGQGLPKAAPSGDALDWMEVDVLAALLDNEHPQVGALIVSSLSADLAAQALGKLEEGRQTDLLLRAARLGRVSVEAITELEDIVSRYVGDAAPPPKVELGGSSGVAKIMNSLGKPKGERLIKAIRKADKPIADAIEEGMFVFEDLMDLDAKALGTVMRSVDSSSLVFALKGAPKELVDRIFASMSQRAAQSIQDEMAEKTMVKRAEVDEAQKAVIAIARQLADAGEIVLGSAGNDYV